MMQRGSRVIVIRADDEFVGCVGTIVGFTKDGLLTVQLEGVTSPHWQTNFKPHDLELNPYPPRTFWWQLDIPVQPVEHFSRED